MTPELTPSVISIAIGVSIAAHIVLIVLARKINALYLLAGTFCLLSPLSAADFFTVALVSKYARVYVTVLIVVLGIMGYRVRRLGPASTTLWIFVTFYICAAFWSAAPLAGLMYKATFGFTILAGMFLAFGSRDRKELERGMRFLGVVGGFAGLFTFAIFLANPQAALIQGRLSVIGLNANRVGNTAAALLLFCAHLALYDRSLLWKLFGYLVSGLLTVVIIQTGSRAALAMALIGCFGLWLPLTRRPVRALIVTMLVAVFAVVAMTYLESPGVQRLIETVQPGKAEQVLESRAGTWRAGTMLFRDAPVLGIGWYFTSGMTTGNLHNMYLQTAVEAGLVGLLILIACLAVLFFLGTRLFLAMRRFRNVAHLTGLPLALVGGALLNGAAESGVLAGSVLPTLILGFGVGLIDRLPALARIEMARAAFRWKRWMVMRRLYRTMPPARPNTAT